MAARFRAQHANLGETLEDVLNSIPNDESVEKMFSRLKSKATRGTKVRSLSAPALSTEFVKSSHETKATGKLEGALAEIIFPSKQTVDEKLKQKHPKVGSQLFTYESTKMADTYPATYGEKSAQSLAREDNIYQLRGTFPAAVHQLAKLRACVEARQGDLDCVNRLFARMWGLSLEDVEQLPYVHVVGNEATRLAAIEDRAYHSLAGHPGHTGGVWIDMATIASDALGPNVPISWQRTRTGLRTIAHLQISGDPLIANALMARPYNDDFKMTFDFAQDDQPTYHRSAAWEIAMDKALGGPGSTSDAFNSLVYHIKDHQTCKLMSRYEANAALISSVDSIARLVAQESNEAIAKTIQAMHAFDHERQLADEIAEENYDELADAYISTTLTVPKYKMTRTTLKTGFTRERLGPDYLPDIKSHGDERHILSKRELRECGIVGDMSVSGALHLAVYIIVNQPKSTVALHRLMKRLPDPSPEGPGKLAVRLRDKRLYADVSLRLLGKEIFDEAFKGTLESIVRNFVYQDSNSTSSLKGELWTYLRGRTGDPQPCPVKGDWRDLIDYVLESDEGWTLLYWARIAIGKLQFAISNDILAPIAAGEEVDLMVVIKKSVKQRALSWAADYIATVEEISRSIKKKRKEEKKEKKEARIEEQRRMGLPVTVNDESSDSEEDRLKKRRARNPNIPVPELTKYPPKPIPKVVEKYIPPHLRHDPKFDKLMIGSVEADLARQAMKDPYVRLVDKQVKASIFGAIEVQTYNRQIAIGIPDRIYHAKLVEFYQARWESLQRRIESARRKGKVFWLGPHKFETHPWGELVEEDDLPTTVHEMMQFCEELDQRAWTINVTYLWSRVKDQISSLWEDTNNELMKILNHIDEAHPLEAEIQERAVLDARLTKFLHGTSSILAISIPTPGYIPPFSLPTRVTTVEKKGRPLEVELTAKALYDEIADTQEPVEADAPIFDSGPITMFDFSDSMMDMSMPEATDRYLTYQEIWEELDITVPDNFVVNLRQAFALPDDVDENGPHLDCNYGPVVLESEIARTKHMWRRKVSFIRKRLGLKVDAVIEDDMYLGKDD